MEITDSRIKFVIRSPKTNCLIFSANNILIAKTRLGLYSPAVAKGKISGLT